MEKRVDHLENEIEDLRAEIKGLRTDVRSMLAMFNQARGIWKGILAIGTLFGIAVTGTKLFG